MSSLKSPTRGSRRVSRPGSKQNTPKRGIPATPKQRSSPTKSTAKRSGKKKQSKTNFNIISHDSAPRTPITFDGSSEFNEMIIRKFRDVINRRVGGGGLPGLAKIFRSMDSDSNSVLSSSELYAGLCRYGTPISQSDCAILLIALDRNKNGNISYGEFLGGVAGGMKQRRQRLVEMAFIVADKDGSGVIDFKDLVDCYDVSCHPDVTQGKKEAKKVFNEFLRKWERRGIVDGKVTLEEFLDYYQDISACIDNDDYFELMIRNAWHMMDPKLSPGRQAANTANLRVLVEYVDGTRSVVAIQNDLGLHKDDIRGITSALRRQGHTQISNVRTRF